MCLYTNQFKPQIAKKDIKVYKVLDNVGRSNCRLFEYIIGVEYCAEILGLLSYFDLDNVLAEESYLDDICLKSRRWRNSCIGGRLLEISEGLHSCLRKNDRLVNLCSDEVWYDAIIPAGSEFYVSPLGDIVSNKLIVTGKCE